MLSDSRSEIISKLSVFSFFSFFFWHPMYRFTREQNVSRISSLWQKSGDRVARAAETEL